MFIDLVHKINLVTSLLQFLLLDWSFKKLFGRSIKLACPLATTSKVYVDISSNKVCSANELTNYFLLY